MIPNDVANKKLLKSDWLSAFSTIIREYKVCQTWGLRRKLIFTVNSKQNHQKHFQTLLQQSVPPCCSSYYFCTTSCNKIWTRVLHRFKSRSRHVRDLRWWKSLTIVPAGNEAFVLSTFRPSTIPQKQFTVILIIIILVIKKFSVKICLHHSLAIITS